jgi:hypothetical protein
VQRFAFLTESAAPHKGLYFVAYPLNATIFLKICYYFVTLTARNILLL